MGIGIVAGVIALALKNLRTPSRDYFEAAVFGGVVSGASNQLFESGLTSAGSIIAFNFWLIVLASIALHRLSTERTLAKTGVAAKLLPSKGSLASPPTTVRDDARAF
jgi:hypothetical protein